MLRRLVIRITGMASVLLIVSALVFALGSLIPGDLTSVVVGQEGATAEQFAEVTHRLGLDQPLYVQYYHWLGNALQGDLGVSPITGRNVSQDLLQQIPVSLELALLVFLLSTLVGIPAGILAAVHANKRIDAILRASLLVVFSVPVFVIGALLLLLGPLLMPGLLQISYVSPSQDLVGHIKSMVMPVATIALPMAAMTMQMTRSAMLEVFSAPYIVTARAIGVRVKRIQYRHALRNALPNIITFLGFQLGVMLGGLIVIEQMFSLPGLGRGMLDAISTRDYPMVTATTLVFALSFVVVNAVIDVLYPILDPRQRSR